MNNSRSGLVVFQAQEAALNIRGRGLLRFKIRKPGPRSY